MVSQPRPRRSDHTLRGACEHHVVLRLPAQEPAGARRPGGGTSPAMLPKDVLYGMYQEATQGEV